jgi:hypothetical protein
MVFLFLIYFQLCFKKEQEFCSQMETVTFRNGLALAGWMKFLMASWKEEGYLLAPPFYRASSQP